MNFLHDPTWQFTITIGIAIVSSVIASILTIWLTRRVPIELPIGYETLEIETIQGNENIKAIKEKMQIPLDDKIYNSFCLFTFKIWNNGKKPIQLLNPTPLIIRFKQGVKILGWAKLEREPDYIKVTPIIEDREVRLDLPFLDSKHSITMQLLLNDYVSYFPDVYAELHHNGRNKFEKANNIRSSRQNRIASIILICFGIFSLIVFYSSKDTLVNQLYILTVGCGGYFLMGIGLLYSSYLEKNSPPHHRPLLSERIKSAFKLFLSVLPMLIVVGVIVTAISFFFGGRVLKNCFVTIIFFVCPIVLWYGIYNLTKRVLKKMKNNYTSILIIILTCIFPVIIYSREIPLVMFIWIRP